MAREGYGVTREREGQVATPRHRLRVTFDVNWRGYQALPEKETYRFDSERAHVFSLDHYLDGHFGLQEGHIYYSFLNAPTWIDPHHSLRILWWEYRYQDGQEWIAGAILNEAIEGALGRFQGDIRVALARQNETTPSEFHSAHIILLDQRAPSFSFGEPQAIPDFR